MLYTFVFENSCCTLTVFFFPQGTTSKIREEHCHIATVAKKASQREEGLRQNCDIALGHLLGTHLFGIVTVAIMIHDSFVLFVSGPLFSYADAHFQCTTSCLHYRPHKDSHIEPKADSARLLQWQRFYQVTEPGSGG